MPEWVGALWPLWLIIGSFLFFTAISTTENRAEQRKVRAMIAWAKKRGWEVWERPYAQRFVRGKEPDEATREFVKRFENTVGLEFSSPSFVGPLTRGSVDGIYVEVFYTVSIVNSAKSTYRALQTVVLAGVEASLPKMRLRPETRVSRGLAAFGVKDIQFESDRFNRRYKVEGQDERRIREVLDPPMLDFLLLRQVDRDWQISHQLVLVSEPLLQGPVSLDKMVDDVVGFVKRVPSYVVEDHHAPF